MLKTRQIDGLDGIIAGLVTKATWSNYSILVKQTDDPEALALGANTFPARLSTGDIVARTISDFAATILDDTSGSAVRTTIGAGTVNSVGGSGAISSTGGTTPVISIAEATTEAAGSMSATDKLKLDGIANNANNYSHPNHTGDVTSSGDGATTIGTNKVTNTKLAQVASATIKGRVTANTGNVEDLTAAQVRTLLNVADGANNYSHPNHTGDVTSSGDGVTTIANNVVTNGKLALVSTISFKGRTGVGEGIVEDIDMTAARGLLNVADGANNYSHPNHTGDVTSSGDGATTIGANKVTNTKLADMANGTIKGRTAGTTGDPEDLSAADVRTLLNVADGANNYVHPTGDGNLHVPATSTTNNGKVLQAGATAGSASWQQLTPSDVGLSNVTNHAQIQKPASSTIGKIPKWSSNTGTTLIDGYAVVASVGATGSDTNLVTERGVRDALDSFVSANDAMTFKGVAATASAMPATNFIVGATYKATAAFTFGTSGIGGNNLIVENGDLIICIKDHDDSYSEASNVTTYWTAVQSNLDGAVTSVASGVGANEIPVFNNDTIIASSGKTMADLQDVLTARYWSGHPPATAANVAAEFLISTVFPTGTLCDGVPMICTINGQAIPFSPGGAGGSGSSGTSTFYKDATKLYVKVPYLLETSDVVAFAASTI